VTLKHQVTLGVSVSQKEHKWSTIWHQNRVSTINSSTLLTVSQPLTTLYSVHYLPKLRSIKMCSICTIMRHAHNNWSNLPLPLGMRKQKGLPPPWGSAPWTPAGGTAPGPRYRLALRACHGSHALCSCKLTLKKALWRRSRIVIVSQLWYRLKTLRTTTEAGSLTQVHEWAAVVWPGITKAMMMMMMTTMIRRASQLQGVPKKAEPRF